MAKITGLHPQIKNPNRYNLFVDDIFYCGVDADTLLNFHLKEGKEVAPADLENIFQSSEVAKLYARALDYLARRPRSVGEMRKYLNEKIIKYKKNSAGSESAQVVQSIVDRLTENKYLNDDEFIRWWIEQRTLRRKPTGLRSVQAELSAKNISFEAVNRIWQEMEIDQSTLAAQHFEVVRQKYDLNTPDGRRKATAYLQRKGFNWDEIKELLQKVG
jgi:regulatory protein